MRRCRTSRRSPSSQHTARVAAAMGELGGAARSRAATASPAKTASSAPPETAPGRMSLRQARRTSGWPAATYAASAGTVRSRVLPTWHSAAGPGSCAGTGVRGTRAAAAGQAEGAAECTAQSTRARRGRQPASTAAVAAAAPPAATAVRRMAAAVCAASSACICRWRSPDEG